MRLVIENKTCWRSDDLRRVLLPALREHGSDDGRRYRVLVVHRRRASRRGTNGYAYYHSGEILLRAPKPLGNADMTPSEVLSFARCAAHEAAHTRGVRHDDMSEEMYECSLAVPWAEGLSIRQKPKKAAASPSDRSAAREAKARSMLVAWERRLKRAQGKVRAYKKKVAYYDRRKETGPSADRSA